MKIVVTYEQKDICELIKQDLARQGIEAQDADIKFVKGQAVVSVEASASRAPLPPDEPPVVKAKPTFEAIDGGKAEVDISAVLSESSRLSTAKEGRFPSPRHAFLPGESVEWPGGK